MILYKTLPFLIFLLTISGLVAVAQTEIAPSTTPDLSTFTNSVDPAVIAALEAQNADLQIKNSALAKKVDAMEGTLSKSVRTLQDQVSKTQQSTSTQLRDIQTSTDKKYTDVQSATDLSLNISWTLITGFLVMFMQAGFAMVETGFTRAKNAAHTMMLNFMVYCVSVLGFWTCGFAFQFGATGAPTSCSTVLVAGR